MIPETWELESETRLRKHDLSCHSHDDLGTTHEVEKGGLSDETCICIGIPQFAIQKERKRKALRQSPENVQEKKTRTTGLDVQ